MQKEIKSNEQLKTLLFLQLELQVLEKVYPVFSDLLFFYAKYSFLFETTSPEPISSNPAHTKFETLCSTQDPARDGGNWWNYCNSNPMVYTDSNGLEPNKQFAGNIQGFTNFINSLDTGIGQSRKNDAHRAMLRMGEIKITKGKPTPANTAPFNRSNGNRYIYTKKEGWIDMSHFMFYAGRAYTYKVQKDSAQKIVDNDFFYKIPKDQQSIFIQKSLINPVREAIQDGYLQERTDGIFAPWSSFSYEDLPTDKVGADFGANYFNLNSDISFAEQIYNYFTENLEAINPENAPNYLTIPDSESKNNPSIINKTTNPIIVGEKENEN